MSTQPTDRWKKYGAPANPAAPSQPMSAVAAPDEQGFREWYTGWAEKAGIDPDPDNPQHKYDYRAAFRAGAQPQVDPSDGLYHWPSAFKADDHPNRFVDGVDTKTGRPAMPPSQASTRWSKYADDADSDPVIAEGLAPSTKTRKPSRIADVAKQVDAAATDWALRTAQGLANLVGPLSRFPNQDEHPALGPAGRVLARGRQHLAEAVPAETGAGVAANIATNVVAEGASYIVGGGAIRKGMGMAPAAARKAGEKLGARAARAVGEVGKDALAMAPVDAAVTAVGPENSVAGAIANLTGNETAAQIAENPLYRFASEVVTGAGADALLRGGLGAARGMRDAARGVADVAPLVDDAVRGAFTQDVVDELAPQLTPSPPVPLPAAPSAASRAPEPGSQLDVVLRREREEAAARAAAAAEADAAAVQAASSRWAKYAQQAPPEDPIAAAARMAPQEDPLLIRAPEPTPEPAIVQPAVTGGRGQEKVRPEVLTPTPEELEQFGGIRQRRRAPEPPAVEDARTRYGRSIAQATSEEAEVAAAGPPLRLKIDNADGHPIGAVGTGAGAFAKGRRTQALNRADAARGTIEDFGGVAPDPDIAYVSALDDDPLMLPSKLTAEYLELRGLPDDELLRRAADAEDVAYRNQDDYAAVNRRAMLAGEAKRRGIMDAQPGFADERLVAAMARSTTGAAVGAPVGAALAPEGNRAEGAALGAAVGAGAGAAATRASRRVRVGGETFYRAAAGSADIARPRPEVVKAGVPDLPVRLPYRASGSQAYADRLGKVRGHSEVHGQTTNEGYVEWVAQNHNRVYEDRGRYLFAKVNGDGEVFVVEAVQSGDGYLRVVSWGPRRRQNLERKTLLWEDPAYQPSVGRADDRFEAVTGPQQRTSNIAGAGQTIKDAAVGAVAGGVLDGEDRVRGAALGATVGAGGGRLLRDMDSSRPGFAAFYSRLERAVEGAPQAKATGAQWLGMLEKAPKGVWKAEREWTGIDAYLRENADRVVSREEVLEAAQRRAVRVDETVRTAEPPRSPALAEAQQAKNDAHRSLMAQLAADGVDTRTAGESAAHAARTGVLPALRPAADSFSTVRAAWSPEAQRLAHEYSTQHRTWIQEREAAHRSFGTKYSGYVEPGGENYREILLTLDDQTMLPEGVTVRQDPKHGWTAERQAQNGSKEAVQGKTRAEAVAAAQRRFGDGSSQSFRSPHWDEPNILAHARVTDRTLPNGEKVLFVEEVQSDWAQKGRREGFGEPGLPDGYAVEQQGGAYRVLDPQGSEVARSDSREGALLRGLDVLRRQHPVPDMPFKKTEDWAGLAMKRLIDEAVQGGYDRIAWTTGEQQAKRYDLSRHIDAIEYAPSQRGTYTITAAKGEQHVFTRANVPESELPDIIGKDLADKIIRGEHTDTNLFNGYFRLSDLDLKVGGEGMRGFYDEILPKWVKQYAKKMGVQIEVEPVTLGLDLPAKHWEVFDPLSGEVVAKAGSEAEARALAVDGLDYSQTESVQQMSFRITPDLTAKVKSEGQPLGAAAPEVVSAMARAGAGATAGAALAPEGEKLEGAAAGAVAGVGGPAALRAGMKGKAQPGFVRIGRGAAQKAPKLSPEVEKVLTTVSAGGGPGVLSRFTDAVSRAPEGVARLYQKILNESAGFEQFGEAMGNAAVARREAKRALAFSSMAQARLIDSFTPVLEASRPVRREVTALAKAERALELAEAGMPEKGVDLDAARAVVAEFADNKQVREAATMLHRYYDSLIDYKVENGVLSAERGAAIKAKGQHYIPFIPEDAPPPRGQGFAQKLSNRVPGVRRMGEGRLTGKTVDPFDQAILDTIETERRVANQRIANLVGQWTKDAPDAAAPFVRELPSIKAQREAAAQKLIADGTPEKQAHAMAEKMEFSEKKAYKGHEVTAIVDGETKRFEVLDEGLYESWGAMNKNVQNIFVRVLRPMAQVMRGGVVNNPAFGMTNFVRDQSFSVGQYAIPAGKAGVGAFLGGTAGAMIDEEAPMRGALLGAAMGGGAGAMGVQLHRTLSAMTDILGAETVGAVLGGVAGGFAGDDGIAGTVQGAAIGAVAGGTAGKALRKAGVVKPNPDVYREWLRLGGSSGGYFARDSRGARAIMRELERTPGFELADLVSPTTWWDTLQRVNRGIEEATRVARYKHLVAQGVPKEEAVGGSRDVSVDFLQRGSSASLKTLAQTKAFLNPQLQGWRKTAAMMRDPKVVATFGATLTAPSIALWMVNKDNPEYWERPQWERNMFWLIAKEEGGFIRIPKPFEPGFIFASVPERMLDFAYQQDPERTKAALADMVSTTFGDALVPIPTGIAPFKEAYMSGEQGWDSFRNRPVVGYGENRLLPGAQYDESTSTAALLLERVLPGEQSPKKLDHILRGLTGTLGGQALDLLSQAARVAGVDSRPAPPDKPNPLTGRFATRTDIVSDDEVFVRQRLARAERAYATAKAHFDRGEIEKAERVIDKNADLLTQLTALRDQKQLLDQAGDARRTIRRSELAGSEKRELLIIINRIVADVLTGKQDAEAAATR